MFLHRAADVLLAGGTIAYPTEGVYGIGCMPDDADAIGRVLAIKQRDASKGLILIAADARQLRSWITGPQIPEPDPARPITWIVEPHEDVLPLVRGDNRGLAVRITTNRTAAAICRLVDSPIVSTSANLSGRATARNRFVLQKQFRALVDYIVPGDCGPAAGPSEIRELCGGRVLRAGAT